MKTPLKETKREMEEKQARVALLKKRISENVVPALQQLDGGFYMSASAHLKVMSGACEEIAKLLMDIQQLDFTLERLECEQMRLSMGEEVPV